MSAAITDFLVALFAVAGVVSVVVVAAIIAVIVYGVRHIIFAIRGEEYVPLLGQKKRDYVHLDLTAGSNADSIKNVLKHYTRIDVAGKYASAGIDTLDRCERTIASYYAVLNSKFTQSSLSWDKFAVAGNSTHQAILQNCATLANHVQSFDQVAYRQLERTYNNAVRGRGKPLTQPQMEKRQLLHASLKEMDNIVAANNTLMVELDKLSAELGKLESIDSTASSDQIVEEIRTLIDETKYYSQ